MPTRSERTAAVRAHAEAMRPIIAEIMSAGVTTLSGISEKLNTLDVRAAKGGRWVPAQVSTLLLRLGILK